MKTDSRRLFSLSPLLLAGALLGWCVSSVNAASISFSGLGFLGDQDAVSLGNGISADGSTIVGRSGDHSVRWTVSGINDLQTFFRPGPLGNPGSDSTAQAASADGSVIVGNAWNGSVVSPDTVAYSWSGGNTRGLGATGGRFEGYGALAVSGDGQNAVGNRGVGVSFASGFGPGLPSTFQSAGFLSIGTARGISADGATVVGASRLVDSFNTTHAWVWNASDGMRDLGTLAGDVQSRANAISLDASTIVGTSESSAGIHAVRWTQGVLTELLPIDGVTGAEPLALSGNGEVIVGRATTSAGERAVMWEQGVPIDLERYLAHAGVDLTGWSLSAATGVSANGHQVVGFGVSPDGRIEAWTATVAPTPAAVWAGLSLLGVMSMGRLVRRAGRARRGAGEEDAPSVTCV